jgi:hypothetical protein
MPFPCSAAPPLRVLSEEADAAGGCPSDERDEEVRHRRLALFFLARHLDHHCQTFAGPVRAQARSVTRIPFSSS